MQKLWVAIYCSTESRDSPYCLILRVTTLCIVCSWESQLTAESHCWQRGVIVDSGESLKKMLKNYPCLKTDTEANNLPCMHLRALFNREILSVQKKIWAVLGSIFYYPLPLTGVSRFLDISDTKKQHEDSTKFVFVCLLGPGFNEKKGVKNLVDCPFKQLRTARRIRHDI
jgi:hypothetical protein